MRPLRSGPPRDLLVSGHVNVDRFLHVDSFPEPDRTVPVRATSAKLGGPAANLARVASRYGVATGLVAVVGAEFPTEFERRLSAAGIDLRGLRRTAHRPTPTCFIVEDRDGGQRTLIDQGPMADLARAPLPGAWLAEYAWLHLTTGDPAFQLRLARAAKAAGLRVAADPAQEIHYRWSGRRFRALLAGSEVFFGNRAEVDRALQYVGGTSPDALLAHVPLVVRTEGRRGATAFSRAATVHVPAFRPRTRQTEVGAGDAFRGGFYAGWFAGRPLRDCLGAGARAAADWIEGSE
jgi:sugar/nucleoside kinase (ribokinase family)